MADEFIDKVFEAVELAKATGKIKKGTNEVTKALERRKAKLVVYADNINPKEIVMHLPLLAKDKEIPCVSVPTKEELGAAAGLSVSCAAVAIVEEGEAKKLIKEITAALSKDEKEEKSKSEKKTKAETKAETKEETKSLENEESSKDAENKENKEE